MIRDDFAVLILTHGRADKVYTIKRVLEAGNYTGKWYLVIDDEDDQAGEYIKRYGSERVQVFCKQAVDDRIDTMDTFHEHRAIVYARNAAFDVARKLGLKYFLEFDDDYIDCQFRADDGTKLKVMPCRDLDTLFESMLDFLDDTGALTVAFCQGGDFIGGKNNARVREQVLRKAMNSFFCRTDMPVDFFGTINEDVNMYTLLGSRGALIMSIVAVMIVQKQTQKTAGGMTELYLDGGTFKKSFYSVMAMPSAVTVRVMGDKHMRMHHSVNWECCVPKIINQAYQKERSESNGREKKSRGGEPHPDE